MLDFSFWMSYLWIHNHKNRLRLNYDRRRKHWLSPFFIVCRMCENLIPAHNGCKLGDESTLADGLRQITPSVRSEQTLCLPETDALLSRFRACVLKKRSNAAFSVNDA